VYLPICCGIPAQGSSGLTNGLRILDSVTYLWGELYPERWHTCFMLSCGMVKQADTRALGINECISYEANGRSVLGIEDCLAFSVPLLRISAANQ
jgi:hypothetical protein